jgi:hypothetical protein
MMGAAFWIKRYLLAAVPLFAVLAAVEWFRGSTLPDDYLIAAIWALGAAALFTWTTYRRYRHAMSARFPAAANDSKMAATGGAGNAGKRAKAGRKP